MMKSELRRDILILLRIALVCGCIIASTGCSRETNYKSVDFSKTLATKQPKADSDSPDRLRVAIAAMISPKETIVFYKELLDYLGEKLGYDIELLQRKTYGEINELFPKRQIDLAFICTGPYAISRDFYKFEALATPIIRGQPYYHSYLIVHKNSSYQKLEDLRNRVFAFTDPESNTGSLVPNYWLAQMGEEADSYFRSFTYTYSHDNSILAVAKKLVDAAAIDGHIWEFYNSRSGFHASMTRVIKKSEPFGSPPIVSSVYLSTPLKTKIRNILLGMHKTPDGKRLLNELLIDRFEAPQEQWYQSVRERYIHTQQVEKADHASKKS